MFFNSLWLSSFQLFYPIQSSSPIQSNLIIWKRRIFSCLKRWVSKITPRAFIKIHCVGCCSLNRTYKTHFDLEYERWLVKKTGKNQTKMKTNVQPIKRYGTPWPWKIVVVGVLLVVVVVTGVIYLLFHVYSSIQFMCSYSFLYTQSLTNLTRCFY